LQLSFRNNAAYTSHAYQHTPTSGTTSQHTHTALQNYNSSLRRKAQKVSSTTIESPVYAQLILDARRY